MSRFLWVWMLLGACHKPPQAEHARINSGAPERLLWMNTIEPLQPPDGAVFTESGLAMSTLRLGDGGEHPSKQARVSVRYVARFSDGRELDRSILTSFALTSVIEGWTEGLQLMTRGEVARLWVPSELAYADDAKLGGEDLIFDVELVQFEQPLQIPTPPDVAQPPPDAQITESGLAYRVLKHGPGGKKPGARSKVTVHYSGWTTNGELIDSSVQRDKPATFPLNGVIEGWTEGVQLMSPGDQFRFWIPQELAYKGRKGPPEGQLTFDIELITVH